MISVVANLRCIRLARTSRSLTNSQTCLVSLPLTLTISLAQVLSRPLAIYVPYCTFLSHLTLRLEQLKQAFGALWLFLTPEIRMSMETRVDRDSPRSTSTDGTSKLMMRCGSAANKHVTISHLTSIPLYTRTYYRQVVDLECNDTT